MTEPNDACKVVWAKDPSLGWKATIIGECPGLDEVIADQKPRRERYLRRRIVME